MVDAFASFTQKDFRYPGVQGVVRKATLLAIQMYIGFYYTMRLCTYEPNKKGTLEGLLHKLAQWQKPGDPSSKTNILSMFRCILHDFNSYPVLHFMDLAGKYMNNFFSRNNMGLIGSLGRDNFTTLYHIWSDIIDKGTWRSGYYPTDTSPDIEFEEACMDERGNMVTSDPSLHILNFPPPDSSDDDEELAMYEKEAIESANKLQAFIQRSHVNTNMPNQGN